MLTAEVRMIGADLVLARLPGQTTGLIIWIRLLDTDDPTEADLQWNSVLGSPHSQTSCASHPIRSVPCMGGPTSACRRIAAPPLIRSTNMNGSNTTGPDFLGIGAHKGGSTWLYEMLKKHPGVWMPPTKELHYFDRSDRYGSPSHLGIGGSVLGRLVKSADYRIRVARALAYVVYMPSLERLRWDYRYLTGTPSDDWYRSLFEPAHGKISGEITPAYSMLSDEDVKHVSLVVPETKVIFLIRNPVDRAWSAFQYDKKLSGSNTVSSADRLLGITNEEWFQQRADYVHTLSTWGKYFAPDKFFVGFFDEIKEDPRALLRRIFDFLGLEQSVDLTLWGLDRRVNPSKSEKMPPEIRRRLAEKYLPMTRELSRRLGGYATRWLSDLESTLSSKPGS